MRVSEKTRNRPEDRVIPEAMKEGYRKERVARKEFDSAPIEKALRKSQHFEEFSLLLRERIAREDGATE